MIKEFFMSPQVWAGTDACEPVTWQECKLVPKDVKFIVPEIKCEPKQELWYHEPEEVMTSCVALITLQLLIIGFIGHSSMQIFLNLDKVRRF